MRRQLHRAQDCHGRRHSLHQGGLRLRLRRVGGGVAGGGLELLQALRELDEEGGVAGRQARYQANHARILDGIKALGLSPYVPEEHQCWIITSVRYPESEAFSFEGLYDRLNERGYVIYPGKVTDADCFRIGNIGRLFGEDMDALLAALGEVLREMGVEESTA